MTELFGFAEMEDYIKNRFVYACFCLLIFVILSYFWSLVRNKQEAKPQSKDGLGYLSLTYFLYFVLGMASVYEAPLTTKYIISGLLSFGFLMSLPLFSLGDGALEKMVEHPNWQRGIKLFGFGWVVMLSWLANIKVIATIDYGLSAATFVLLAYFISRYFFHRKMLPLAILAVITFSVIIYIELVQPETFVPHGKFGESRTLEDVNSVVLGPALLLSVMFLAYTFSWMNELDFKELSQLWTSKAENENEAIFPVESASADERIEHWNKQLAEDQLEQVIEGVLRFKKHRNENLEAALMLASRNTRNNNDRLQELITDQEYRTQRNKVAKGLLALVAGQL